MNIRDRCKELLDREQKFRTTASINPKYWSQIGEKKVEEWINDVDIFNQRYLSNHPLYDRIKSVAFHRSKNVTENLVACLTSVYKDDVFWKETYNEEAMNDFEQLLSEILNKIDPLDPIVLQYKCSSLQNKVAFRKLQKEGLIQNLQSVGREYVGFTVTYEGLHYFEEQEKTKMLEKSTSVTREHTQYDLFLSHANRDKQEYVNELKESLDKLGISIFYDKDTIKWGNRWKEKIYEGVEKSEFAIIVISENFFGREWTEKELDELLQRQNSSGQEIILPILHNITIQQFEERYPEVAEIQAISSDEYSKDEIALLFAERLIGRLKS